MKTLRNGILVLMALCVGLQIVACTTLALSGDKRYKVELNNIFTNVQADFDKDGGISPATKKKLDELITKYEADYGTKASFTDMKKMRDKIVEAESNPDNKFHIYQEALQLKTEAEQYLTTEVKSG